MWISSNLMGRCINQVVPTRVLDNFHSTRKMGGGEFNDKTVQAADRFSVLNVLCRSII